MAIESAADLRELVDAGNQLVTEAQAAMQAVKDKLDEAISSYAGTSDKLSGAVGNLEAAKNSIDEALAVSLAAIEEANTYSAVL